VSKRAEANSCCRAGCGFPTQDPSHQVDLANAVITHNFSADWFEIKGLALSVKRTFQSLDSREQSLNISSWDLQLFAEIKETSKVSIRKCAGMKAVSTREHAIDQLTANSRKGM
jgi:hypothetical protein